MPVYIFGKQILFLRDQETSPVISSSRSRSASRSKKLPIKKVANPFLVELDDGEDEDLVNAADFLDQPSQRDRISTKRARSESMEERERDSEGLFLPHAEKAQGSSTFGGLTDSDFGTEDLLRVLNNTTNKSDARKAKPIGGEEAVKQNEQKHNDKRKLGDDCVQKQNLVCNTVDDEEDMFASTPESDNNDNDQRPHLGEDGDGKSNWGSDGIAEEGNLENVDPDRSDPGEEGNKTIRGILSEVDVSNAGDNLDRAGRTGNSDVEKNHEAKSKKIKSKKPSSRCEGVGEMVKESRRFHQKVVPVDRSARGSAIDLVNIILNSELLRHNCPEVNISTSTGIIIPGLFFSFAGWPPPCAHGSDKNIKCIQLYISIPGTIESDEKHE